MEKPDGALSFVGANCFLSTVKEDFEQRHGLVGGASMTCRISYIRANS